MPFRKRSIETGLNESTKIRSLEIAVWTKLNSWASMEIPTLCHHGWVILLKCQFAFHSFKCIALFERHHQLNKKKFKLLFLNHNMSPAPDLILGQGCRQTMGTELSPQASQAPCPLSPLLSGCSLHMQSMFPCHWRLECKMMKINAIIKGFFN